jgi:hypothetical protein
MLKYFYAKQFPNAFNSLIGPLTRMFLKTISFGIALSLCSTLNQALLSAFM